MEDRNESRGGSPDNMEHKGIMTAPKFKTFLVEYAKRLAGLYLAKPRSQQIAEGVEVSPGIMDTSALVPVGAQDMTRASQQCEEAGNRKPATTRLMREDVLDAIEVISPEDRLSHAKGI